MLDDPGAALACCFDDTVAQGSQLQPSVLPIGLQVRWYALQHTLAQLADELGDMHNAMVRDVASCRCCTEMLSIRLWHGCSA